MQKATPFGVLGALLVAAVGIYFSNHAHNDTNLPLGQIKTHKMNTELISKLKQALASNNGKVLTPEDQEYQDFATPWSQKCLERPYVVLAPATQQDAGLIIREINKVGERFVISSGGHDYECLSTTTEVLISTKLMKATEVNEKDMTITVQAGVLWGQIYAKTGYTVIGGLCPTVSVSGFALGGGFNWLLSRLYGSAAENVLSMRVVLASGEVVTVTRDNKYADLAWGLLGSGGQQLGLVLEFTMRIYPKPQSGYKQFQLIYFFSDDGSEGALPLDTFKTTYKAWTRKIDQFKDRSEIGGVAIQGRRDFSKGLGVLRYDMIVQGICKGCSWEKEIQDTVDDFTPNVKETLDRKNTFLELQAQFDYLKTYPLPALHDEACAFIKDFSQQTMDVFVDQFIPSTRESASSYVNGVYLEAFLMKGGVKNKDRTSLAHSDMVWKLAHAYVSPSFEELGSMDEWTRGFNRQIREIAGTDYLGGYVNYMDLTLEKSYYYDEGLQRLKKIKAKYDPDNVFRRAKGILEEE